MANRQRNRGDESDAGSQQYDEEKAMTGLGERAEDAALWRRWRLDRHSEPGLKEPDPMLLAAYSEGRLDETEAEGVEAWLLAHPAALDDVLAAGGAVAAADQPVADRVILRAAALVSPTGAAQGTVVPFPLAASHRRRTLRALAAWGGLAASLFVTSLVGFGIGNNAYDSLAGQSTTVAESVAHELTDPPSTLFEEDEEPGT
jgi:hypothetical protein